MIDKKISKKLYNKMLMCAKLEQRRQSVESEINNELESLNFDIEKIAYDDLCLIDMMQYGHISTKERVEKDLSSTYKP